MLDAVAPGGRERRLVSAILVLATIVLFFVAVNLAASAIGYFGDVLLAFFLAWLLAGGRRRSGEKYAGLRILR